MKKLLTTILAFALGAIALHAADAPKKNWTPPAYKIYAQVLSDQIMAAHPEIISITFHGVPPGLKDVYTMFAGSYPDRIGNPDELGSACAWLCSAQAGFITGQNWLLDGGAYPGTF